MYAVRSTLCLFLPASCHFPPGVMLRKHRSTAMNLGDSSTDIKKTYRKGASSESELIEA